MSASPSTRCCLRRSAGRALLLRSRAAAAAVVLLALALIAQPAHARVPADEPCVCANGGTRLTAATRCLCSCAAPAPGEPTYVAPTCSFTATDRVRVAVTWRNSSTFALDRSQDAIRSNFAGRSPDDVVWVQRLPRFEADATEVVVQYVIAGAIVDTLLGDVASGSAAYLQSPLALDAWVFVPRTSAAGSVSRYFASSDVLGVHSAGSTGTVEILAAQLDFFIAALALLAAVPLAEGLLVAFAHPTEEQLDSEARQYGGGKGAASPALASFSPLASPRANPLGGESSPARAKRPEDTPDSAPSSPGLGPAPRKQPFGVMSFASMSGAASPSSPGAVNPQASAHW